MDLTKQQLKTKKKIQVQSKKNTVLRQMWNVRYLYLLVIPLVLYYLIFCYKPMYGILIAFKDFKFKKGIMASPWVGFKYFNELFQLVDFWQALKNTLIIAFGRLVFEFPVPIIISLLLNEVRKNRLKRFYQTVYTFPHFLSWVVISGIALNFLGSSGVLNEFLVSIGCEKVNLLVDPSNFRGVLYLTNIWKEMGWGTIIYLATIAGIDPTLYEAASIDGANRLQQMKVITWPSLLRTVVILLILQVGNTMNVAGFDQVFNLYNPAVYDVADILDTYVYRRTFSLGASFSSSTAVGLFKSVINCALLLSTNWIAKKLGQEGIM